MKLPDPLVKALGDVVDEARSMALGSIQDARKKQQAEALFSAVSPTLKGGDFDGALVLTSKDKQLTLLTAFKVQKGDELGKTVRELAGAVLKDLPPEWREKLKLDVATVGPTRIHKLEIPVTDQGGKMAEAMFGELSLYVAFTNDAMYLSLGKDGLQAIKEAIPVKATSKSSVLFYEVDVAQMIALIHPEQADKAKAQFPGGQKGTIRFTVEGGTAAHGPSQHQRFRASLPGSTPRDAGRRELIAGEGAYCNNRTWHPTPFEVQKFRILHPLPPSTGGEGSRRWARNLRSKTCGYLSCCE